MVGSVFCLWLAAPARAQSPCIGDCNTSHTVTINEIIECVNIALGSAQLPTCPACSANGTTVQVTDLISAVNNAINGCPSSGTPTLSPTGGTPTATVMPTVNPCPLQPGTYAITSVEGGTLNVSTFAPFAFPPGGVITADVSAGDANCVHSVVVPFPNPKGFTSPEFCVPALGATVMVTQTACGIGRIDSNGGSDYTVAELGDTSFTSSTCNVHQTSCPNTAPDSNILVRVTVGDGTTDTCTGGGTANALIAIPVNTLTWVENANPGECPAKDGTYNPDKGDVKLSEFPQTLDFTSDTTSAKFQDLDGDGCFISGLGPAKGFTRSGTCLDLTKLNVPGAIATTTVASGTVGSPSNPWDLAFLTVLPNTMSGPTASIGATCTSPPLIDFHGTVDRCIVVP